MNQIKLYLHNLIQYLRPKVKEYPVQNNQIYTEEQLMARLKFFIGVCLSLTLFGIVFVVLYSLIFVTQPLNAISPIDSKFFELIIPIATFLTGTLSGIMLAGTKKEDQDAMLAAQKLANENFDAAGKRMNTPALVPPRMEPSFGGQSFTPSPMPPSFPPQDFQPQIMTSSNGKPMPFQPPHPEI